VAANGVFGPRRVTVQRDPVREPSADRPADKPADPAAAIEGEILPPR
jgi:hypothetical protein